MVKMKLDSERVPTESFLKFPYLVWNDPQTLLRAEAFAKSMLDFGEDIVEIAMQQIMN